MVDDYQTEPVALAREMRANGIRRLRLPSGLELELFDTIPAPPPEDNSLLPTQPDELKPDSQCRGIGCAEPGGWMGTRFCRAHGLAVAGVKS
jgi:hypothetical protein